MIMLNRWQIKLCMAALLIGFWALALPTSVSQATTSQQITGTAIPPTPIAPTLTPAATTIPLTLQPTSEAVSYTELLAVHKDVLDTTRWAMTITLTIISLLLSIGGIGGFFLYRDSLKGIEVIQTQFAKLAQELETSKRQTESIQRSNQILHQDLTLESEKIAKLSQEFEALQTQARLVQREIQGRIPRLEALADVDTYAMRLFSTDPRKSRVAKKKLIELSKDDDPLVRRACVRVFRAMPDYPQCFPDLQDPSIVARLEQLALNDLERGVKVEARKVLKKLGVDLGMTDKL